MKNTLIVATFAIFVALFVLGVVAITREPQTDTKLKLDDVQVSTSFGGAPDQEVATDFYESIIKYAQTYPELRPMIRKALADDRITYAECDKIDEAERTLALQLGAVEAHQQSDALRKHLAAIVKEKS